MSGGFDLYGNYYPREIDAINAEMAQCAEIDARIANQKLREMEAKMRAMEQKIHELEQKGGENDHEL